jgi:hypothetical protein
MQFISEFGAASSSNNNNAKKPEHHHNATLPSQSLPSLGNHQ